jgi:Arc/MetJ family transcription regulator
MSKTTIDIDDFDFGFTSTTSDEIAAPIVTSKNNDTVDKLLKAIMPLLDNLAKDPEKDVIHWPNRKDKIEAFRRKLYTIAGK